jgi:hypothetical protein
MYMNHLKGLILILLGIFYLIKPYIFDKGVWFKTIILYFTKEKFNNDFISNTNYYCFVLYPL